MRSFFFSVLVVVTADYRKQSLSALEKNIRLEMRCFWNHPHENRNMKQEQLRTGIQNYLINVYYSLIDSLIN